MSSLSQVVGIGVDTRDVIIPQRRVQHASAQKDSVTAYGKRIHDECGVIPLSARVLGGPGTRLCALPADTEIVDEGIVGREEYCWQIREKIVKLMRGIGVNMSVSSWRNIGTPSRGQRGSDSIYPGP